MRDSSPTRPTKASRLSSAYADAIRPRPPTRPLAQFAGSIRLPDGPRGPRDGQPGDLWDYPAHPAQREIVRALGSGRFRRLVVCGPGQDGKTLTGCLLPILWWCGERGISTAYCLPDKRLCGLVWRDKLKPAIRGSGFAHLLPEDGPGSQTGSPDSILLSSGGRLSLLGAGAGNEAGQAMVTARVVIKDERDAMRDRHAALFETRSAAFGDEAVIIEASTIKHDREKESAIENLWQAGPAGDVHLRCPGCGTCALAEGADLRYDATSQVAAARTARRVCRSCGLLLDEAQHRQSIAEAQVVYRGGLSLDQVTGEVFSIRWGHFESPLHTLAELAVAHLEAVQARDSGAGHDLLRTLTRDRFTRRYEVETDAIPQLIEHHIAARSAQGPYRRGVWPSEATHGVLTVDNQLRRLYWLVTAFARDGRIYLVDYGRHAICGDHEMPTPAQRHAGLDAIALLARDGWPDDAGLLHRPDLCGVDAAFATDEVVGWQRYHAGEWVCIRGLGEEVVSRLALSPGNLRRRLPGWLEIREQPSTRTMLHLVDVDTVRAWLHNGLDRKPGTADSVHLPLGEAADGELARHLTAEVRRLDDHGQVYWYKRHQRNDLLDCGVYAAALGRLVAQRHGRNPADQAHAQAEDVPSADQTPINAAAPVEADWVEGTASW